MRDIFLSYSRKDHREAASVYSALREADITVWFDVEEAIYGEALRDKLKESVELSRYFVALITNNWLASEYCRSEFEVRREFVSSNNLAANSFLLPIASSTGGVWENLRLAIKGIFVPSPRRLPPDLADFVYLDADSLESAISSILTHIRSDGPDYVKQCSQALVDGVRAEEHSDALARLLARYPTVSTIDAIWQAAFTTRWPTICVDLAARSLHYGMRQVVDHRIHAECQNVIRSSVASGIPVIVDKFAYTAGNLQIYTWQVGAHDISASYARLIDEYRSDSNPATSTPYIYTKARVEDWIAMLGMKGEGPFT